MHRDPAQWATIRRRVLVEGASKRQIARDTRISRNTIRKILKYAHPKTYGPRSPRYPVLGRHIATINRLIESNVSLAPRSRLSAMEIYRHLKTKEAYQGSYSAIKIYVRQRCFPSHNPSVELLSSVYDCIISLDKSDAIKYMQLLSGADVSIFSIHRASKFFDKLKALVSSCHEVRARQRKIGADVDWIHRVLHREIPTGKLLEEFNHLPECDDVIRHLYERRLSYRNRAMAVLAHSRGISNHTIASVLKISRRTVRKALLTYRTVGTKGLFAPKARSNLRINDGELKAAIFSVLHEPPANYKINRTSWTMAHLQEALSKKGKDACPGVIRSITKAAGYKWRKARVVLTSNDPDYTAKLSRIQETLSSLQSDEAFFSIDEFGPFAIRSKGGRLLVAPGETPVIPQWQKSKGCLILTAALELSSNQVTHFYSARKNTSEMVRMMDLLLERYKGKRKIYLSWDAASWHVSKQLFTKIDENNRTALFKGGPIVDTAPLPARAQFLNVVESIFSGMARAIIHNSDYKSVDEAKAAIDRYFFERNQHFRENPRRAGNKIWGKERVMASFSESNNCKDPRYR